MNARGANLVVVVAGCWMSMGSPSHAQTPSGPENYFNRWESNTPQSGIRLATFAQTAHWAPMPSWSHPELAHSPLDDPLTLMRPHPMPVTGSGEDPLLGFDPLELVFRPVRNVMDELYANDFRLGLSSVLVYQNISRSFGSQQETSFFSRFDVAPSFRAWDLEGHGNGIFTALLRANNNLLDTPSPGAASGSFSPLDDVFSGTSFLINRVEFQQQFFDKSLCLTVGKANPNDVIASNLFAWDEDSQFLSVTFDGGNYPAGYGGYFPMVALQAIPTNGFYVTGMANSAVNNPTQPFASMDQGLYFCAGEVGTVLEIGRDKLQGRYSVSLMNSNTGPDTTDRSTRVNGSALALVAQQQFGENTVLWSQYLYSAESIGPASREWTMGLSIEQCFGRKNDGFGIAIGWSAPSDEYYPGWRENLQLEAYYRCQVTHSWQLSPDFQVFRPSDPQASGSAVFSFALRLLTTF